MNTDSKLKRYIVLLDKAPFVLFLKSANYLVLDTYSVPALKKFNLDRDDAYSIIPITEKTALFKLFSSINRLPDPIIPKVIDALTSAIMGESPTGLFSIRQSSVTPYIVSNEWQERVEWQNVDNAPETAKDVVIAVCEFTHDLLIFNSEKPVNLDCDGQIVLACLDRSAPFPQALLKECMIEIHDIIIQMSANRITADKTKSKYLSVIQTGHLSVMQTGHDSFNYINLRQIEKDLKDTLATFNIAVEE